MSAPRITVLMTVYNGGNYLRLAVNSVLEQSYKDFEFLIIEDKGTDGSLEFLRSLRDPRVRIHANPQNLGQTKSLNIGLELARGEYVARMDADDYAFPHWLENQLFFIEQQARYTVVSVKAAVIDEGNRVSKILNTPVNWEDIVVKSLTASPINHVGSMMEKSAILEAGGYDESFKMAADYDLWSRLIASGKKITTRDEIGVAIRVHAGSISISERGRKDIDEISRIISNNIQALTSFSVSPEDIQLLWRFIYDPATLTFDQFMRGETILQDACNSFRPEYKIEESTCRRIASRQVTTSTLKRIFAFIRLEDMSSVRRLARVYIKKNGSANILGIFLVLSYCGKMFIGALPSLYEGTSQLRARGMLMNKPFPQLISSEMS